MFKNFKHIATKDFLLLNLSFILGFSPVFLFLLFPIHLKNIGAHEYQIGIAMGMFSVGALVSKPKAGKWIDTKGRSVTAYTGFFISIISFVPMIFFENITVYYFMRFMFGIGVSFCMTSIYTIMLDISPPDMIGQAVGLFGISNFIVSAIAAVSGEFLIRKWGFEYILYISIINLIFSMLFFSVVKYNKKLEPPGDMPFFKTMTGPVRVLVLSTFVFGAAHSSIYSFIAVYLKELSFGTVSLFFVCYASGAIFMRLFFGYMIDQVKKEKLITLNFVVYSVVIFFISFYPVGYFILIFAFLGGIAHGFLFPVLNASVVTFLGTKNKGTAASIFFIALDCGMGVAPFAFGYVSGIVGYKNTFLITSILVLVYSIISNRYQKVLTPDS